MEISKVSFTGLRQTKNGNLYNKTNVGKNIGTAAGLGAGVAIATLSTKATLEALNLATTICKNPLKIPGAAKIILGVGVLVLGLAGRLLGGIPDFFVNKSRKVKADSKGTNV